MEEQTYLNIEKEKIEPEIKVIRNRYLSARSVIIEELTKKTWVIPIEN